nr:hypothetical protein [uncultured Halomonas sp.]
MSDESAQSTPWWLEPGAQTCDFCQRTFHYEVIHHCVHCDRPICPFCVTEVRETQSMVCSECDEEGR